jgi:hypothetical protein
MKSTAQFIYMSIVYAVGICLLCVTAGWMAAVGAFMLVWGHQIEKHSST